MSNPGAGRARGRGRARGENPQGGPQQNVSGGRARGSGPPRPMQQQQQQYQQPAPMQRQPPVQKQPMQQQRQTPAAAGRAAPRSGGVDRAMSGLSVASTSSGDPLALTGRGGTRSGRYLESACLRTRPERFDIKTGVQGTPVNLVTNYFKLMTRPNWTLYQYRVDISPEEDRTAVRKSLLRDHRKTLGGYIFDGTVMYTPYKLNADPMNLCSKRTEDDLAMSLTLKLVGDVTSGDYVYIQIFNILMRKCYSSLKLQLLGRDFYDQVARIDIREHKLQIWPGYKTTIAQHEQSILMVAEITHKVIRTDTVHETMKIIQQQAGNNFKGVFCKEIIGQIVLTDYNNKTYRIDDVDWSQNPLSTFVMNEETITYAEYYKKKYQLTIKDLAQPLLCSRAKARDIRRGCSEIVLLIPELSRMTGLDDKMRADFRLMKSLSNYTRVGPESRIMKLLAFNKRLATAKECVEDLKQWDMKLDDKLTTIVGRQLPCEQIYQGERGEVKYNVLDTNDGWTKNLRANKFVSYGLVKDWAVVTITRLKQDTTAFIRMVMSAGNGMGFNLPPPLTYEISHDSIGIYITELERIISQKNPSLIFCVISNNKVDLYNAIKKKCCVDRAVPTQIVVGRTLSHKSAMSIATKVAIQMNCKLGGSPWSTMQPVKNLMVIGYDVCHDPRNKSNSYGAMVASINQNQTKYYNAVTQHKNGEELASEFCVNIKIALKKFKDNIKELPSCIIIYRDGVGEGQIAYVYNHEVEVIKSALQETYGTAEYHLQFVIVSKRLNTRFFQNSKNPRPGTVIDDVVTNPNRYDFFLVSQAVRDGTVAPTSYNVIFDNTKMSVDYTQRMAYKFCHMYYNFSGQVRVPAPCQYAHKLAFLSSQNLHNTPHVNLNSVLFFL
ncbi:piwi like RNA-mediated gene silencing protein aubergine [Arctopsyche grandis]|uniref:piwi like RNA-mediated gene silencing protein aubergine n=1 Tax=Arctopsyche grandis TaxID=121162 RepID=UPI00406D733B